MATSHGPRTSLEAGDARKHGRRSAVIFGVVLACAAIVVPFGLHGLDRDGASASAAPPTAPSVTTSARPQVDGSSDTRAALGSQGDLPPLLASDGTGLRHGLQDGARVRVGDITEGVVRRTPGAGWQVLVRWNGRLQALPTRGRVSLRDASWVAASGLLYTRVPTGKPGRFHVYAWDPQGGSAYTPPTLFADDLGRVCFNDDFTAFGNCRA
ncbi:MAG TPA: hypothetical protein VGK78_11985 [Nocardioides sp.]|uniref:hypothetical protein n=1 Tax=Nocardioides sp. TaxID=35761 RepID=UPI002F4122D9